jgi:hypothetical protein
VIASTISIMYLFKSLFKLSICLNPSMKNIRPEIRHEFIYSKGLKETLMITHLFKKNFECMPRSTDRLAMYTLAKVIGETTTTLCKPVQVTSKTTLGYYEICPFSVHFRPIMLYSTGRPQAKKVKKDNFCISVAYTPIITRLFTLLLFKKS